ncbi:MAG: aldehyde dehydrogenase family protein [Miltoncostaeaceae bacterium]
MARLHPSLADDQPTGLLTAEGFVRANNELVVRNPHDGAAIAAVALGSTDDVERAVAAASAHLPPPSPAARAEILDRAAVRVGERIEDFARTICLEAGKPIAQARLEAERCVDTLTFSAVEARTLSGEMVPMEGSHAGRGKLGLILREPIGVVGAIAPFNFPLNRVAHKVAPAIAAGCPVVLKPASSTPLSALLLAKVLIDVGLPPGFLTVVTGGGRSVGGALVDHPDVPVISFTGSPAVGWGIRAQQPRKEVALELGNSTPVIVADDADVDRAVARLAASGFTHAGQSCISVQRIYVASSIHRRFVDAFVAEVERLRVGDPAEESTQVGPVIDDGSRERIGEWIEEARGGGAEALTGGDPDAHPLRPTVLAGVTPTMRVSCEEVFGPVVSLVPYAGIAEAIALANSSPFGLQAGIFAGRVDHAIAWAKRLRFGGVTINETPTFRVDQQPYGGVKDSGNTREGPRYAVRTMTEQRFVALAVPDAP